MSYINEQDTYSQRIYYNVGLKNYLTKVYNYMAIALGITAIVAFLTVFCGLFQIIYYTPLLSLIVTFSPVVLVFYMSYKLQDLSYQSTVVMFFLFSVLMGFSLSYVFIIYTTENITRAFLITSIMFSSMSLYGNITKRDLTSIGSFLLMGIWGLIIATIVNMFLGSTPIYFAISLISVIIFTLLTAYDAQRIKDIYYKYNYGTDEIITIKLAILAATSLYFNFINIFLNLLRVFHFSNNKD
ncbi:Bax inhibitor-1/YccA family protein [Wolbachia endosymbiont of Howardula sp.]|uniref:Bax inhibitor-1/YccA family protein n=1 Tax=Wolbachia endosymbiont of Howardula sp. TaxID=2916816 RepID=UPI00217E82E9|nr:Bax inhibitor-1/YccA family protein [Wolbachia endosymbiont of Howardula sp.]UWI83125.1 Bax inhibitor-1/YccA family protein [Wolbachia endosymbiont of Howardula sp.]